MERGVLSERCKVPKLSLWTTNLTGVSNAKSITKAAEFQRPIFLQKVRKCFFHFPVGGLLNVAEASFM